MRGLRTAVKPSRRTTDRGELHQPKKRGARQLAVPHTGAELVVNGSRKLISWRQGGFHRASQHVLDRLGVRVVVDASCEEGAGSPRSCWRWPHGRAKTPRDEPLDRCARRSTPSWPPRVARAVRPRCPREPGRPGRPRRAGPGRAAASARRRAGRGLGGLERRTAAIHEALEIIDSVLHCRHADSLSAPITEK
jgi:hypothetical protein